MTGRLLSDLAYQGDLSSPTPGWAAAVQWHRRRLVTADVPLALFASQILVLHFPGMIERVIGGVQYQVPERPLAGQFTL